MTSVGDEDVSVGSFQGKSVDDDGTSSTQKVIPKFHREESSISSIGGDYNDYSAPTTQEDLNLPPGRMNAVKGCHRLQGSGSNLMSLIHSRNSGTETPRSRSISPSMKDRATGTVTGYTSTTHDGNSSLSSCDDASSKYDLLPDNDIFTDRAGFVDDLADNIRRMHNSRESLNLPQTVNERMTEDSLEDNHAFSDLQARTRSSNVSLVSGVSSVANEAVLEPLDECEEGLEDSDSDDEVGNDGDLQHKKKNHPTIILTNMENLNINQERILEEEDDDVNADEYDGAVSQRT